jgi:hypothetical protein
MAELLKALSQNDFRGCSKAWKAHMWWFAASNGNYFEGLTYKYNHLVNTVLF